eukprot:TRINITY_DN12884_c0_g1_i1.p1 TRINITY_DN12884_c0_g1~~TRINITY_DN12884_c0_g1_i1.p1  ORF type:complete len:166 (-),score=29.13 TRINITY_DN12884_c0_g1_i1:132-587(-)
MRPRAQLSCLLWYCVAELPTSVCLFFFFNDTATTEIYTRSIVGSVRCVQETVSTQSTWACVVSSDLTFSALSDAEIRAYVETEQPMSNSGSYMLQLHGSTLCEKISGCFYGVWGFPLNAFAKMLIPFLKTCLLYTSPSPRDLSTSRMPSSA